jgi:hypothetical protein
MLASKYKVGFIAALICAVAWIALGFYDRHSYTVGLASDLNIPLLPGSVRIVQCDSPTDIVTDVVYKCVLDISADEFPLLLRGYKYKHYGHSYEARPKQFKHGGRVLVTSNPSLTQATIDVYVE